MSALLSGAYLLYVSLIPTSASCAWCGVHYPKPGIEYPYFVAASIYAAIAINTARASRNDETQVKAAPPKCRLRGRPAVVGWACTLTAAYGLASAGTFILDQWGSDAGYCLINVRSCCLSCRGSGYCVPSQRVRLLPQVAILVYSIACSLRLLASCAAVSHSPPRTPPHLSCALTMIECDAIDVWVWVVVFRCPGPVLHVCARHALVCQS